MVEFLYINFDNGGVRIINVDGIMSIELSNIKSHFSKKSKRQISIWYKGVQELHTLVLNETNPSFEDVIAFMDKFKPKTG